MNRPLADILHSIIPEDLSWKITLLKAWPEIVGKLADRVSIFGIEHDRIILQTSHPAWAQELNFLAPLIIAKIDALIGPGIIQSISFKIVKRRPLQTTGNANKNNHSLHATQPKHYAMTRKESEKLDLLQDEQLREALRNYLLRTKART